MNITNVQLNKSNNLLNESKIKAYANIVLDNEFVVSGIKVFEGKNGMVVLFPRKKRKNGDMADIAFPITQDCRSKITEAVLKVYNNGN